jgi:RND family efflux transporter MFP subunit
MPVRTRGIGAAALALALFALLAGCGKGPPQLPAPEAPPVAVANPGMRPYAPYKEFTGRLATKDPVKVVPRVSGIILRRLFADGTTVTGPVTVFGIELRQGQRLFDIDPVQYDADVKKSIADQQKAAADIKNWTAQIELAEAELKRVNDQLKKGVGIPADKDKAVANLDVAKAQKDSSIASKAAADANRVKAEENLRYCTVYAPATGRVNRALVAEGALVDAYKTELVEVFPVDPIYAIWEVDELTSLWYRSQIFDKGEIPNPRDPDTPLRCWITLKDGMTIPPFSQPGVPIKYFDPVIIRGTGTRVIRAEFPNPTQRLSDGDSVRVRVDAGKPLKLLAIPETAVFAQQRKRYVYVVDAESKAQLREVEEGARFDRYVEVNRRTSDAADATGLRETDRVIVDNLLRVRPGIAVKIRQ